jgi:hypothetical protein
VVRAAEENNRQFFGWISVAIFFFVMRDFYDSCTSREKWTDVGLSAAEQHNNARYVGDDFDDIMLVNRG